jgi:hypothetical protein
MENLINQFETIQIIEQPEKSYKNYNFLCKCDKRYDSFTDFENHVRENHNCRDLTLAHLTGGRRDNNEKIKYFWTINIYWLPINFWNKLAPNQ